MNLDYDSLFETVSTEEFQVSNEEFRRNLNDLVDIGLLERNVNEINDEIWYTGKPGLHFAEFSAIDDSVKKYILLQFISNPAMFFVLFNTQKGKSAITIKKIITWAQDPVKKFVPILMLESNIGLGDQTVEGIKSQMEKEGISVKLFKLVSTDKLSVDEITNYIDTYVGFPEDNKPMPLIVALTNDKQTAKVLEVLSHIMLRQNHRFPNLCYGLLWDEADKTYTFARDRVMCVRGKDMCIRNFTLDNTVALGGCGWITATEGSLLDSEEYPECANAYSVTSEINEEDEKHYRAFHHEEAIIKTQKFSKKNNNENFMKVFTENKATYFMKTIRDKYEKPCYRKTIINSSAKTADHMKLAKELNSQHRCHAMTFNQSGLTVYAVDMPKQRFKTKGRSFNELLMYVYKKCNLHTAPLFIIGRRKVDRGLSFHYAPRSYLEVKPKTLDYELGPLELDGIEGLIWTDMFLGHVEIKESAVQKAGRLAGIFAHCPQYTGSVTWWTDDDTAKEVKRHYEVVDKMNRLPGCNTMVQAMAKAEREVPQQDTTAPVVDPPQNTTAPVVNPPQNTAAPVVDPDTYRVYDNEDHVKKVCELLGYQYNTTKPNKSGFKETSLNTKKAVVSLKSAIDKVPTAYGTHNGVKTYRTCLPCYLDISDNTTLRFVVIIRPTTDIDKLKNEVDTIYPPIVL
jgi:hypothetical protein